MSSRMGLNSGALMSVEVDSSALSADPRMIGVVALVGLVLDVGDGDGDPALALLGGVVDRVERPELGLALEREGLGDRRGERGLAVVDVTDRAHVHVRLVAQKLLLGHRFFLLVEPTSGIEPETSSLPRTCSTN